MDPEKSRKITDQIIKILVRNHVTVDELQMIIANIQVVAGSSVITDKAIENYEKRMDVAITVLPKQSKKK
jgi:hypothetical protein